MKSACLVRRSYLLSILLSVFLSLAMSSHLVAEQVTLDSVMTIDETGRLHYVPDDKGNILPDFSYSGYQKSNVPIPHIEAVMTLEAIEGDNTQHIQNAIDQLAQLPLQSNGFRGALLLKAGRYEVAGQLVIRESGLVLRGEGQGKKGTLLFASGQDKRSLIHVEGKLKAKKNKGKQTILNPYVPVGSDSVQVANTSHYSIGQSVVIVRPSTKEWISDLGMDVLPKTKDGRPVKQWQVGKFNLKYERTVTKIEGKTIYLDIPLVQMMEDKYGGGVIYPVTNTGRINHIGIENMRIVSEYKKGWHNTDEDHSWIAIEITGAEHVWVSDVASYHFAFSAVKVGRTSRFVTVRDSSMIDAVSEISGGRRYSFFIEGSQVLFLRCTARNGRHDFITSSRVAGPNAFVYSKATKTHSDIGPHHRWATGTLYDNVSGGDMNVQDRLSLGTGHGWAGAQQVLWNTKSSGKTSVQSPPGAINWSIGHIGERWGGRHERPQGVWISQGKNVQPESLFVQQLIDRIGEEQADRVLAR
ncbi:hypothetical protein OFY17_01830 [Marinomonas sp. C2222]|uniref:Peptidoglycan-binding protein n=1 Tax=Marinomonas sargassi TaxID=2984494 RepID=A0ABT2YP11_9GAMM|nr:hypothetical protein [Marinomonas sargassi]MCV2401612.1 hypothetical protein [Marinomonas sargassi]